MIQAMGAEHIKQERLQQIVQTIVLQANNTVGIIHENEMIKMIRDKYDNDFRIAPLSWIHDNVKYVVEQKWDGFSYLCDGAEFYSRRLSTAKGHEGEPVKKTMHIKHLYDVMKRVYEECGCDLHGELYSPGGISDDVTKIMGCTPDEAMHRQFEVDGYMPLHYMLIDIRQYRGHSLINEPYYIRRALLEYVYHTYIKKYDPCGYIVLPPILSPDPVAEFRRIVLASGEGIMIKRTDAPYTPGKKPVDHWIKGKKKVTLDVVITGFNDGTGKNKKLFGSIEFGVYVDGVDKPIKKLGSCSSGLEDSLRLEIAKNPDGYIDTVIEIEAMQESKNSFRNAVFLRLRPDKDRSECKLSDLKVKENLLD